MLNSDGNVVPTPSNNREKACDTFEKCSSHIPWFGIEQEYFIMENNKSEYSTTLPFVPNMLRAFHQGQYYCGVGSQNIMHRQMIEEHMRLCLIAGIKVSGANAEVAPNQWEFQIGPCIGIDCADQLWVARYILMKLSEKYSVNIDFSPKPIDFINGSGLHTNFSDLSTRGVWGRHVPHSPLAEEHVGGLTTIYEYINRLSAKHQEHLSVYGTNTKRLSGKYETSSAEVFTYGIGSRNTSIRIPRSVASDKCGYFEDRRPASDADPYLVCNAIASTVYGLGT